MPLMLISLLMQAAIPAVGVVSDPCAALPGVPAATTAYRSRIATEQAAGRPQPAPTAEEASAYLEWQKALRLADFPNLCRYRAANAALPPATKHRVVFMGDSITEGWSNTAPRTFDGDRINRGISGQTTTQMLARFRQDVIDLHPRAVHIMAGTNDIAGNLGPTTLDAIEGNIRSMAELARAHGIRVVIGAVPPAARFSWRPEVEPVAAIAELNRRLRTMAERDGLIFADYYTALDDGRHGLSPSHAADGVHPNAAGYAVMQPVAEKSIAAALR